MINPIRSAAASFAVLALIGAPAACAQERLMTANANSIQPETTLSISTQATVNREPDIAFITAGVQTEAPTASEAMRKNAQQMTGVFNALKNAGVDDKDMQTSNFSLQPRYDYNNRNNSPPKLIGYTASNQLSVKVRDLEHLGQTMDALVSAGGNTFSGLRFALDDDSEVRDEARTNAMKEATERAELYADAAGLKVLRIVTISEGGGYNPGPQPMMAMRMASDESASTPIAAGEVGYTANVSVVFELGK